MAWLAGALELLNAGVYFAGLVEASTHNGLSELPFGKLKRV